MNKISLQDMSEILKISKTTISLVLNGRGDEKRVNKDTQERIRKFARENNYKANYLARSLSLGRSEMIGLVVPNISDNFYARIARRIEKKAENLGYNVVFCSTGESKDREAKLIKSMLDRQVDGLIIASSQKNYELINQLKSRNFPFVLIDRYYSDIETNIVSMNNAGGIKLLVEHLIKQGRRRIAFVSISELLEPLVARRLSYKQTMEENGLPVEDGFICELSTEYEESEMADLIKNLIISPRDIDGIVFATHFLAADGLRELKRLGVKMPKDIAIVSYGQMSTFDVVDPPITSVLMPSNEIGDAAVDMLFRSMKNPDLAYETVSLNTTLVVRKSSGG